MASPLSAMETQADQEQTEQRPSSSSSSSSAAAAAAALAGPGTTRQNRRLQLRKNGFRGRAMPNRNVTPKRSSSGAWSSPAQDETGPAAEGVPAEPGGKHDLPTRGRSSSVLQEVSNSSLRRKAKNKAKHDSVVSIFQDENSHGKQTAWSFESSPACLPLEAPNLTKSRKKHQRTTSNRSNADNELLEQHIAYLEGELAACQTQLASLTSPSAAKEKSQRLRALHQDVKRLEAENARWETDFDQRVGALAEEHAGAEAALRARIHLLEADTDKHVQKVRELQAQLDAARKALDMAESANVEFERRLETFAHLLVLSPKKPDTPLAPPPLGNAPRHSRQRLSLHRFPTAGALQQSLPSPGHAPEPAPADPPPDPQPEPHEHAVLDSLDTASDAECESAARVPLSSRRPRHSLNLSDLLSDPRNGPPARRMRRFHGGSHMPKPLILGAAAQLSPILASAPVLEPHQTPHEFPFPDVHAQPGRPVCHGLSPLTGRRRAMTSPDGIEPADLEPLADPLPALSSPQSGSHVSAAAAADDDDDDDATPKDFASVGRNVGRNLFEELCSARPDSASDTITRTSTRDSYPAWASLPDGPSSRPSTGGGGRRLGHRRSASEHTALPAYPGLPGLRQLQPTPPTRKQRAGVLAALSELWRAPLSLARRCLLRAHSAVQLSRTLHRLQWWLVHALLGPMATRRLMATSLHDTPVLLSPDAQRRHLRRRRRAQAHTSDDESDAGTGAGSPCPPSRGGSRQADHHGHGHGHDDMEFSRHSPWLWVKFSLTLAFAIGAAIKEGPGALMRPGERDGCACLACSGGGRDKTD